MDLLDLYRGGMSLRKLHVLVKNLPREANTAREIDRTAEWSVTDYLLAHVVDALNGLSWITVEVNRHKGRKSKYPKPIARPGDDEQTQQQNGSRIQRDTSNLPRLQGDQLAEWLNGA